MRDAFLTLFGIGYLRAPGTCASVVSLPIILGYFLLLPSDHLWRGSILVIVGIVGAVFAVAAVAADEKARASHDRSSIVIDECVGMYVALLPLAFLPDASSVSLWWKGIAALVLFRIFDIGKPFGIRRIDAWHTPASVILDDLAAGAVSALLLWLFFV